MFSNPIVGGTVLIRPAIQSPNYAAGSAGWSINQDGSAEFNDVSVRGDVVVGTDPNTVSILPDPVPHIEFSTSNASQQTPGYVGMSALGGNTMVINGPDFGQGSDFVLFQSDTGVNQQTEIGFWDSLEINKQDFSVRLTMNTDSTFTGPLTLINYVIKDSETWHTPTFASGWATTGTLNTNSTFHGMQYRKDAEDNVWIYGAALSSGTSRTIFTMGSSSYFPPVRALLPARIWDASAAAWLNDWCQVTEAGVVNFAATLAAWVPASGDQVFINAKYPLGNIS